MIAKLNWNGHEYCVDFSNGTSLAIDIDPHGHQPSFFAGQAATAKPLKSAGYIGDVNAGGSCNAEVISFVPHCHGTHTECVGHLSHDRITVQKQIFSSPGIAQLLTLDSDAASDCDEHYAVELEPDEPVLTLKSLQAALHKHVDALIIRTLPNQIDKKTRDYAKYPSYPVFSSAAIQFLAASGLRHILLDTPSLDRASDQGLLANHRCWWGLDGQATMGIGEPGKRSVTELIYVADEIEDGLYWLHLELSPLVSDATPSRPVIYRLENAGNSQ